MPQGAFGLRGTLGTISIVMSVTDRASAKFERIAKRAGSLSDKVMGVATKMRMAGVALTAIGATMTAVFSELSRIAMPVERSLARLTALAYDTGRSFEEWLVITKELATSFIIMPEMAAGALYHIASAGVKAEAQIKAVAEAAFSMATIHGVDVVKATEAALTTAAAYGIELERIEKVTNIFNSAIANSLLTLDYLREAMKYAAPVMASAGVSLESLTASLMTMANAGIRGSMAGRILSTGLIKIAAPTVKARKVIKELGVEFFVLTERGRGIADSLDKAIGQLQKLEDETLEVEDAIKRLSDAMEGMSIREKEARLMMAKLKFRAAREGRELDEEELERIARLELSLEGLGIERESLALLEAREQKVKSDLVDQTTEATEREAELAAELELEKTHMKDLGTIAEELGNALLGMGAAQRMSALDTLFGKRAIRGWLALIRDAVPALDITQAQLNMLAVAEGQATLSTKEMADSTSDFTKMLEEEGKTGGATARLFEKASESLVWSAGEVEKANIDLTVALSKARWEMTASLVKMEEVKMAFIGGLAAMMAWVPGSSYVMTGLMVLGPVLIGLASLIFVVKTAWLLLGGVMHKLRLRIFGNALTTVTGKVGIFSRAATALRTRVIAPIIGAFRRLGLAIKRVAVAFGHFIKTGLIKAKLAILRLAGAIKTATLAIWAKIKAIGAAIVAMSKWILRGIIAGAKALITLVARIWVSVSAYVAQAVAAAAAHGAMLLGVGGIIAAAVAIGILIVAISGSTKAMQNQGRAAERVYGNSIVLDAIKATVRGSEPVLERMGTQIDVIGEAGERAAEGMEAMEVAGRIPILDSVLDVANNADPLLERMVERIDAVSVAGNKAAKGIAAMEVTGRSVLLESVYDATDRADPLLERMVIQIDAIGEAGRRAADGIEMMEVAYGRIGFLAPLTVSPTLLVGTSAVEGATIGEINVSVVTGPVTGVSDVEEIGDVITERIIDKINQSR